MRKLVFGLLGFAALGVGALSVQPAAAQPYYPGYGYRGPAVEYRYGRPAPAVRVQYGRPYYRASAIIGRPSWRVIARSAPCAGAGSSPGEPGTATAGCAVRSRSAARPLDPAIAIKAEERAPRGALFI